MHSQYSSFDLALDALNDQEDGELILATLRSIEMALTVVDTKTSTIVFVSDGFKRILPALNVGDNWDSSIRANSYLAANIVNNHQRYSEAKESALEGVSSKDSRSEGGSSVNSHYKSGSSEAPIQEIRIGQSRYNVHTKALSSGHSLISLKSATDVADNLRDYMQARDSLFSTSRTISVSEMATTLAHEINTPVGTITNILRGVKLRLQKTDISTQLLDDALNKALEQTQYTQSVINRIRDFTQSRRPNHVRLDIRNQVRDAISLLDWMLSTNHCALQCDLPENPIFIVGDSTMLQQVLVNLLRNAIDAMQERGASQRFIRVAIVQTDSVVTLSISDTGSGLEAGTEELFVPFATNKANGMGVGLNICRSFIELHQGRLWLSDNETSGCTSYIELPVAQRQCNDSMENTIDA